MGVRRYRFVRRSIRLGRAFVRELLDATTWRRRERAEYQAGRLVRRAYLEWDYAVSRAAYEEAYRLTRDVVDHATGSSIEFDATVAAIERRMGIGPKIGYRRIHPDTVADAVDAVLERRPMWVDDDGWDGGLRERGSSDVR